MISKYTEVVCQWKKISSRTSLLVLSDFKEKINFFKTFFASQFTTLTNDNRTASY